MKAAPSDIEVFGRIVDPTSPLMTTAAAEAILALEFPAADRRRQKALAAKARAGTLTKRDQQEIDVYARVGCMLGVLKSKARRTLGQAGTGAGRSRGGE